ncbi:hypothetical protein M1B34_10895 [Pseudomonas sp. MAFF 302030]|uniref:DUF1963 domain-containing protein n=1 Tax=Pseudomonas morbosilactucae TaxID=2938197 RepID=A0A9X1YUL6_9PSED|nr:hypothetical protein [Pseudomonas morbosilactucae]MCK9798214.1 hypothetical protein [Pseudomonas morbosilactucae]MCK9814995.1 hypothetical protein [Pseudomonas morbosilactucae]
MDIQELKQRLAKPAVKFSAGGFRPTHSDEESWLGRVFLYGPDEELPCNPQGEPLLPFAQFYLPALPFSSPWLEGVRVLTLFVGNPFPDELEPMGNNWVIREYRADDVLVRKELTAPKAFLKPFPLKAEVVAEDYPLWDGGGIPRDLELEVLSLERDGTISCYYDLVSHCYEHKLGGYPSFCQAGIDPGDGFEFVMQISSDAKINLNVIHSGSLMFWKHRESGEWAIYYDFY